MLMYVSLARTNTATTKRKHPFMDASSTSCVSITRKCSASIVTTRTSRRAVLSGSRSNTYRHWIFPCFSLTEQPRIQRRSRANKYSRAVLMLAVLIIVCRTGKVLESVVYNQQIWYQRPSSSIFNFTTCRWPTGSPAHWTNVFRTQADIGSLQGQDWWLW